MLNEFGKIGAAGTMSSLSRSDDLLESDCFLLGGVEDDDVVVGVLGVLEGFFFSFLITFSMFSLSSVLSSNSSCSSSCWW